MNELRAFFKDLAGRWHGFQLPGRGEVLRRLLPYAPLLSASGDILEVGTGTGALIPCLREGRSGARLVSVDLAVEMLRPGGHLLILHDLSREKVRAIQNSGGQCPVCISIERGFFRTE